MENTPIAPDAITALTVQTSYAIAAGKKIAYRSLGEGKPLILCNRFRGILDSWDPAFLDRLSGKFRVITFDYTGIGLSTGVLSTDLAVVAEDIKDLAGYLQLDKFILLGWSYGGTVAQTFATRYPDAISHLLLLGTNPPGKNEFAPEPIFMEHALKPVNDLDDEVVLFFEPGAKSSRKAAKKSHERIAERTADLDTPVPESSFGLYLKAGEGFAEDMAKARERLGTIGVPILVISGDHDIVFPVENWYALTRKLPNMYLVVLPRTGHAPQHQHPRLVTKYIRDFIKHTK